MTRTRRRLLLIVGVVVLLSAVPAFILAVSHVLETAPRDDAERQGLETAAGALERLRE